MRRAVRGRKMEGVIRRSAPYTKGGIAKFRLQPQARRRLRRPLSNGDRQAHWSHSAECVGKTDPPCDTADSASAAGLTYPRGGHAFAARAGAILLYLRRSFRPKPKIGLHCQTPLFDVDMRCQQFKTVRQSLRSYARDAAAIISGRWTNETPFIYMNRIGEEGAQRSDRAVLFCPSRAQDFSYRH
jgi:hypothetical protein